MCMPPFFCLPPPEHSSLTGEYLGRRRRSVVILLHPVICCLLHSSEFIRPFYAAICPSLCLAIGIVNDIRETHLEKRLVLLLLSSFLGCTKSSTIPKHTSGEDRAGHTAVNQASATASLE